MLLKMKVSIVGAESVPAGDEHDFDAAEALRLVAAGYAAPTNDSRAAFDKLRAAADAAEKAAAEQAAAEAAAASAAPAAGAEA